MNAKEKPAHGGNRERAKAEKTTGGASIPVEQFTTRRGLIASVLCEGKGNALTGREIKRILALKDGRDVTALVERERRGGVPICATCNSTRPGYFLPQTPEELEHYTKSLRRRIGNIQRTLTALEMTLDEWTGQQRVDGWWVDGG